MFAMLLRKTLRMKRMFCPSTGRPICMFFHLYKIIAVNGVRHNYTHFFVLVFFVTFKQGQCLLFAEPLALFAKIRNIWFLQRIQMSIMPVFPFWLTIVLCIQNVLCSILASVIQEFLGSNLSVIGSGFYQFSLSIAFP